MPGTRAHLLYRTWFKYILPQNNSVYLDDNGFVCRSVHVQLFLYSFVKMQQLADSMASSGTLRDAFSSMLFLPSSHHFSSSTPECFFMVWPLVKWSIMHQSMSSWPLRAPQEIYCQCWSNSTVKLTHQFNQSFKTAFVFWFCSSGWLQVLPWGCFPPWNLCVHRAEHHAIPLSPATTNHL